MPKLPVVQSKTINNQQTDQTPDTLENVKADLNRLVHQDIYKIDSPVGRALAVIGDKYSLWLIDLLHHQGKMRFLELEKAMAQISPRTLSARLKHLEQHNLISRFQHPTIPPKVEYELTDKGRTLIPVLQTLTEWSADWYGH